MGKEYCVYIMTNIRNTVLYTGVTNNLKRRVLEHKTGMGGTFTKRYNVVKLIYFEVGDDVNKAIFGRSKSSAGIANEKKNLSIHITPNGRICTMKFRADLPREAGKRLGI
jgi:putative endonuclease